MNVLPDFTRAEVSDFPFAHFRAEGMLDRGVAAAAFDWLREEADWRLRVESFYEQHEVDLLDASDERISPITSCGFVEAARKGMERLLPHDGRLEIAGVAAHRLTPGQTIRIHNDHIGEEETHRLLLQLNEGWTSRQGGLLMLFSEDRPEALADIVLPVHASGFGFRISPSSHHAVSTIRDGARFTVVYTFRQAG